MTNRSENIKALMTFVGLTIVLTTIGSIIMDKKFEEDQKEFEDRYNYQTDQTIKVWDSLLKMRQTFENEKRLNEKLVNRLNEMKKEEEPRKKSNYEKIYEEFLENRRKMINGEL
jgi:hypothetical protein|nr:MAG TPA: hypothetical protein [Caudoviricetes sp.]